MTLDPQLAFARRMDRADGLAHYRKRFVGADDATSSTSTATRSAGRRSSAIERVERFLSRGLGRPAHPRLGRVVDAAAVRDRRSHRPRRDRGDGRADGHRRLDHGAALQARPRRRRRADRPRRAAHARSCVDTDNFPTDRYVLEGIAAERGLTPALDRGRHRRRASRPSSSPRPSGRRPRSSCSATSPTARRTSPTRRAHAHRARRRRARALGPLPLGRIGARRGSTPGASTSPSAAPTSTSTAGRAPRRSPTCATTCRTCSPSRSRAGWARPTCSRWAPSTQPARGIRRFVSGTPPIVGMLAMQDTHRDDRGVRHRRHPREVGRAHGVRDHARRRRGSRRSA